MKSQKLELIRGDDHSIRLLVLNPDKTPVDLSSAEFDLHAKTDDSDNPVIQLSTSDGTIETASGRIVLHFAHDTTKDADWESANYDLQMRKDGKRKTILQGKIKLIHDYTRV